MSGASDPWGAFSHDPRDPAYAPLRASDQDRAVVHEVLAEAYADGRLDREEFDLRTEQTGGARTLGELPTLMSDLVALSPATRELALRSPSELQAQARRSYESDRREAFLGMLGPSLVCVVIWMVLGWGELGDAFFWPGFVIAGTGLNVVRTLVRRQDIVDQHVRRLEKKQAKELRARRPDGGADDRDEE